jgi:hypothetical protein
MNIFQNAYHKDLNKVYSKFHGVILDNVIGDIRDLVSYFETVRKEIDPDTKLLISYHNPSWEPILNLASRLGLRKKVGIQNWLSQEDLKNILELSGFEVISSQTRFFGITTITVAKPQITNYKSQTNHKSQYSTSIIIPARNEEGNIAKIIPSIPKFGKWQEIIFVEGNSTDQTWKIINKQITNYKLQTNNKSQKTNFRRTIKAFKQKGRGKADAVRLGFEKATGDILMIYDADRTVDTKDLPKFYNALAKGIGEFANGDRLTYPMEAQAMQTLNKFGNQFFSFVFTKIFGQHFKDTLCGTKALFRHDFLEMKKDYLKYLKIDPFGDFALIFSAIKHNLKVVEIPVHYKEREYGTTNISRFRHGLMLFKMAWIALKEFKL